MTLWTLTSYPHLPQQCPRHWGRCRGWGSSCRGCRGWRCRCWRPPSSRRRTSPRGDPPRSPRCARGSAAPCPASPDLRPGLGPRNASGTMWGLSRKLAPWFFSAPHSVELEEEILFLSSKIQDPTCFEQNTESEVGKLLPGEVGGLGPGGAAPDAGEAGHEGPHPGRSHRVCVEAALEMRGHRGQ